MNKRLKFMNEILETFEKHYPSRVAGTKGELKAGLYIADVLGNLGYKAFRQNLSFITDNREITSQNFIARKSAKSTTEHTIVIGAHYDNVDIGKGIDDNASGVALLLDTARYFKKNACNANLVFAFFGSEEARIERSGSEHYVNALFKSQRDRILCYVNLDSLLAGDFKYIHAGGSNGAKRVQKKCMLFAKNNGIDLKMQQGLGDTPKGELSECGDTTPFQRFGIPYIAFEASNWEIGSHDGYTQIKGTNNWDGDYSVWHTENDKLKTIRKLEDGRIDKRLSEFSVVLRRTLQLIPQAMVFEKNFEKNLDRNKEVCNEK